MNSPLIKKLCGALDKISSFKARKRTFAAVFVLYIVLLSAVTCFHEPWFDEAQAWQIAKCASLHDILFKIPHYEGHPPLWHLFLLPFAKTGMPYELSLAFVNILFIAAAAWVIMFKTKLPDLMKLTLPFTYFLFYQYGVISRPYSVLVFTLMLCGIFYREKNQKPVRMVLSLALMCLSSAYGMAVAAGICVVWLIEEWNGKNIFKFIKEFVPTRAFFCLLGLFILAAAVLLTMLPYEDTFAVNDNYFGNIKQNLLYILLILPLDATVGSAMEHDGSVYAGPESYMYAVFTAAIVFILFLFGKKRGNLKLLVIPYIILVFVCAQYMFSHHIGIITAYLIFWLCTCFDSDKPVTELPKFDNILRYAFTASACIFIFVQIVWSVSSSVVEIKYNYSLSRETAEYIKENNLENEKIMSAWNVFPRDGGKTEVLSFNSSTPGVEILPYFDRNIFINFNWGRDDMGYTEHREILDEEEYAQTVKRFEELGTPSYIFGTLPEGGEPLSNIDNHPYYIIADVEYGKIFKGFQLKRRSAVYKFGDAPNAFSEERYDERTD